MCTWTPCLTYSRSSRLTCKRRVKLLYKGLCCAIGSKSQKKGNICLYCGVPTIESKSENKND